MCRQGRHKNLGQCLIGCVYHVLVALSFKTHSCIDSFIDSFDTWYQKRGSEAQSQLGDGRPYALFKGTFLPEC